MANASWVMIACVIGLLWNPILTGSGDTFPCEFNQCPNTVIEFNVTCNDGLLKVQWSAPDDSFFGFCIQYQCSMDPHLEYCTSETKQWGECENIGDRRQIHTYMYSNSDLPDNSTCWFWVKDVSYELNGGEEICSRDVYCIISQAMIRLTSTLLAVSSNELSSSMFQSSPVIAGSFSTLVSTTTPQLTNSVISVTEKISTVINTTTTTTTAATTTTTTTTTTKISTVTDTTTSVIQPLTTSTTLQATSSATLQLLPTGRVWQQNSDYTLLIAVALLFVTFLVVLLVTIMLLVYRKKREQGKLEIELRSKLEKVCGNPPDVLNDSMSDIESLPLDPDDFASILSEDRDVMLRQIVDVEDNRKLQTESDSESDYGDADMTPDHDAEVTSGYYSSNNGSGGQCCSQSNFFNNTGAPSLIDDS